MACIIDGLSTQMRNSLDDLSNELSAVGLEALKHNNCSHLEEICEKLLSTSWSLINLVHSSALGFSDNPQNNSDRELLLLNEKQSLHSKLEHLRCKMAVKEKKLAQEKENIRKLQEEVKKLSSTTQKQKQMISQLSAQMEIREQDFKHGINKQQVECEQLREMVRKSLGVAIRPQHALVRKLENAVGTLCVSDESTASSEQNTLHLTTLNRLKSVNQTLVSENLMLRDALKMLHTDIHHLLGQVAPSQNIESDFAMSDGIFRLPLSYCMNKLSAIRLEQIGKLNVIFHSIDSNAQSQYSRNQS